MGSSDLRQSGLDLTKGTLRVLGHADLPLARDLLRSDVISNVFVASRVEAAIDHSWRLGGELWGYIEDGELTGLCYAGANLVPATNRPGALRAFSERARRQGRRCSSMVGPQDQVEPLWTYLRPAWGEAREVRREQPLLAIDQPPRVAADPQVRRVEMDEIDTLLPACVSMFTEEVGVSPLGADGGVLYRARVRELVASGRSFARIENGRVLFKAEIGAASAGACQVQGVWVDPAFRGSGLAAPGMATVVALAQEQVAPVVSLYVNAFNISARRAYERVGFNRVGTFATVLF